MTKTKQLFIVIVIVYLDGIINSEDLQKLEVGSKENSCITIFSRTSNFEHNKRIHVAGVSVA